LSEINSFRESPLFQEALEAKRRHGSELERAVAGLLLAMVRGRCVACGGSAAYVEREGRLLIFCDTCGVTLSAAQGDEGEICKDFDRVTLKQSFRRDGGGGGASP